MNRLCALLMTGTMLVAGCGTHTPEKADSGTKVADNIDPAKKVAEEIDLGAIENSTYRNNYFGLTVKLPPDWNVQDREARQQLADMGTKMLAGKDQNTSAAMKAAALRTVTLLSIFKFPRGAPVTFNPNINCVAELVRDKPGIKTGKDYHFHLRRTLEAGQMKFAFPKEISTERLGGRDFDVMYAEMPMAGITVRQKYYATVMKGYVLLFVVTFGTAEDEASLDGVLKSVAFK